ncbi:MAG: hypothetical protein ABIP95_02620 [Pelobium sp.]
MNEEYLEEQSDTVLKKEALKYRDILMERFKETSITGQNKPAYHLLFYSSFGNGESIKFEQIDSSYYLSRKCISSNDHFVCGQNFYIQISTIEWDKFEEMIYEYNFWTSKKFNVNKKVLDGYAYFLEGNRPEAFFCKKRNYHLIGRSSPEYDKMEDLCNHIMDYEERLVLKYGKEECKERK